MRPYACPTIDADLLAAWRFAERLDLTDYSGQGVNLSLPAGGVQTENGLVLSRASSQYASGSLNVFLRTALTLEVVFTLTSLPAGGAAYGLLSAYYNAYLYLFESGGTITLRFRVRESGNVSQTADDTSYSWQVGTRYRVAGTWAVGQAVRLWGGPADGALVEIGTPDTSLTGLGLNFDSATLAVGSNPGADYINGTILAASVSGTVRYAHGQTYYPPLFAEGRRGVVRGPELSPMAGAIA